jgi:hypothetical protein
MVLQTNSPQEARKMLSTRIRTTIAGLAVTCSFGTAVLAPAVSQADRNNHGYAKTVGKRVRPWMNTCANAATSLENWSQLASSQLEKGETKAAEESIDVASKIKENAKASGCTNVDLVRAPKTVSVMPTVSRSAF